MSKIVWDKTGEKLYETGADQGVLYPKNDNPTGDDDIYAAGVPWNGLINVNKTPSGGEPTALYADNIKYANMMSNEDFGATIESYTYPAEFSECLGEVEIAPGVYAGQQPKKEFGFTFRTLIGNDVKGTDYGYKLHLVYNALAGPSEKGYATVNDSPEAITFSHEMTTTPEKVTGHKPTACLTIDSTKTTAEKLAALEAILYGTEDAEPRLPLPDEVLELMKEDTAA